MNVIIQLSWSSHEACRQPISDGSEEHKSGHASACNQSGSTSDDFDCSSDFVDRDSGIVVEGLNRVFLVDTEVVVVEVVCLPLGLIKRPSDLFSGRDVPVVGNKSFVRVI